MNDWNEIAAVPLATMGDAPLDKLARIALALGYDLADVDLTTFLVDDETFWLAIQADPDIEPVPMELRVALLAWGKDASVEQPLALPAGTNGDTAEAEEEQAEEEPPEQHQCPGCPRSFLSLNALNAHFGSAHRHAGKTVTCPECGKECRDNRGLAAHQRKHTPATSSTTNAASKPVVWPPGLPMLACRECDFITAKPLDLAGHTLGAHSRKVTAEERTPLTAAEREEHLT